MRLKAGHLGLLVLGMLAIALPRLAERAREESQERTVTLAADWSEVQAVFARTAVAPSQLLSQLHDSGVTGLVVSPLTLSDLLQQHRFEPQRPASGNPLDTARLRFDQPALAEQVYRELSLRGVPDLVFKREGSSGILERKNGRFESVSDIDAGYDETLVHAVRHTGLTPIFRVTQDAWSSAAGQEDASLVKQLQTSPSGIYWGGDDLPGGSETLPLWKTQVARSGVTQFLFEFKPAKAAVLMARAHPASTYKAHTIPVAEFKDSTWAQQKQRWIRAVDERMCRLLLMHVPPTLSGPRYLDELREFSEILNKRGFRLGFPEPRVYWPASVGRIGRLLQPVAALLLAVFAPLFGLWWSVSNLVDGKVPVVHAWPMPVRQFLKLSALTLVGALFVAAVADHPYTRLEIVPFRGVKLIFVLSMLGALGLLFSREELMRFVRHTVTRWEIIVGLVIVAAAGYILLRTGNAPAAARSSLEQPLRDFLERILVARPRFKEFALGHPLVLLGYYIQAWHHENKTTWDGRVLIWLGMIGQVSMVNTFCHLHSPLRMEIWRSINGLCLGFLIGIAAVVLLKHFSRKGVLL